MKIFDIHTHLVQYLCGFSSIGETRYYKEGKVICLNKKEVLMLPDNKESFTYDDLISFMDKNSIERSVLLQGYFYGLQNYYTYLASEKYPHRLIKACMYDPYCYGAKEIRKALIEDLKFKIVKFETSTGSGIMSIHPEFRIDDKVMIDTFDFIDKNNLLVYLDMGKCLSPSYQIEALASIIDKYPSTRFIICHLLACNENQEVELIKNLKLLNKKNVYFDLASVVHNVKSKKEVALKYVKDALNIVKKDKLMFGSDLPSCIKESTYEEQYSYFLDSKDISLKDKEDILFNNAEKFFKDFY